MDDYQKTKPQLIEKLKILRKKLASLEETSHRSLGTIIRDSGDGILVVDFEGRILSANPAAEKTLGRESGEMAGSLLGVPTLSGGRREMDVLKPDGTSVSVEIWCKETIWEGLPAVFISLRDLTERRAAEAALRESEAQYRALFETMSQGVIYFDKTGRISSANPAAEHILGLTLDQMKGNTSVNPEWRFTRENGSPIPLEELPSKVALRTGRQVRNVILGIIDPIDDKRRWIRFDAIPQFMSGEKKPYQVYVMFDDITERKEAFDQTQRLAAIVRSTGNAVISKTLDGTITSWNPAATRIYGYSAEEAIGQNIAMLVPDDLREDLARILEIVRKAGTVAPYETLRRLKDGSDIPVSLTVSPVHDETGKVVGASAIAQDISELKRALAERESLAEQFHQSQKLESVGRLAGGVAHDFNNMLNVILGYGELIMSRLKDPDPIYEFAKEMVKAGRRAAALTRQLLAFSRKQKLQPRVIHLNDIISGLEKMLGRLIGEDIQLTTLLADDLSRIKVDPGQIEQVIMNVAVNARDAMPKGGVLTIETRNVVLDEKYAEEHVDVVPGEYVRLTMTDNGCGMDEQTRKRLFEPFFTTKDEGKGTGLGLATVYGIIKQSNGHIWVYTEPGQGTSLRIYLPCTADQATRTSMDQRLEKNVGAGERILVVEDEPSLRKLCEAILKKSGFDVLTAANGGEALILIEEKKERPDLVITDVVMPGMSGKVLVDRLKMTLPDIKVLFMSGYTDDAIVQHGILDTNTPFIEKPFNTKDLIGKVTEILLK